MNKLFVLTLLVLLAAVFAVTVEVDETDTELVEMLRQRVRCEGKCRLGRKARRRARAACAGKTMFCEVRRCRNKPPPARRGFACRKIRPTPTVTPDI